MQTFYQFLLTYRGALKPDKESQLANWAFYDHGFPKYANTYNEISYYIEEYSPFIDAVSVFDDLWRQYEESKF